MHTTWRAAAGTDLASRSALLRCVLLALAAATLLALAGCGGDDEEDAAGGGTASEQKESSAPAPEGEPIKVFTMTTLEAQNVPTYENIKVTAETYEKWINENGGIKGRPLEVTVCDDRGDPTQATACAREAVQGKAVAGVGSFTFFGDAVMPVLEKGDTAWFGICCAQSAAELKSKASFGTGGTLGFGSGLVAKAVDDGCKTINAAVGQSPRAVLEPIMRNAAKAYGVQIKQFVTVPDAAQDLSPQVTQALNGNPDCVVLIFGESSFKAWMPAWQQAGTKARMYGPQGNLNEVAIKGYEQAAEGAVIGGPYPDISTDGWKDFRQALEDQGASDDLDYNSLGGLGAWSGFEAFRKVVEGMNGEITNKTFLDTVSKASVEVPGQLPKLDFSDEWTEGLPGYSRLFNCAVVFSKIEGGKVVPLTTDLQDAGPPALGKGKLPEAGAEPAQCGSADAGAS